MSQRSRAHILSKAVALFLMLALLSGLGAQNALAAPLAVANEASAFSRIITVQALIDGKSQLILHGNTAQWLQIDFAAPGRWADHNDPTIINEKVWFPSWPDTVNDDNYSCNCYSSVFKGIAPALPRADAVLSLTVQEGRGSVTVVQAPAAANDFTTIIQFDDDFFDGAANYQISLNFTVRSNRTVTVSAVIDGRSQLVVRGSTARWYHLDFAAPGRLEFSNDPTVINGKVWYPVWPDVPDAENRDCYCYSSTFKGLTPALPSIPMNARLTVLEGRGTVTVLQQPAAANNYTLVVEFDDNPQGGAALYRIQLDINFVR